MNIKLQKDFLSLQEGFEWNEIPMFSVITGINGAGKTHLLKLFYKSTTSIDFLDITNSKGDVVNLLLPRNKELDEHNENSTRKSFENFVQYFLKRESRLGEEVRLKENIKNNKRYISHYENELESLNSNQETNKGEIINKKTRIEESKQSIYNSRFHLTKLKDDIYEKEIERISRMLDKDIEILKEKDIRENARNTFEGIFEIDTIKQFISEELQDKNKKVLKFLKLRELDENKILEINSELESYVIINNLFLKYGFGYYTMIDPSPSLDDDRNNINITANKISLTFKGRREEIVGYDDLSSGEQIIVKIIMLARSKDINGENINTIILDEPDAHLHPSLSKMMIEILEDLTKPIEEGGANLRVIITTHSPSTVAFAPEKSLFLMERDDNGERRISSATKEKAISILSDGIFTFKEAIANFELITKSTKNNILCVEGKTDITHIETAMSKLNNILDLELLDLHDAGTLESFIKSIPATVLGSKKIIGLLDSDGAGFKSYRDIKGDIIDNEFKQLTSEQSKGQSYICCLPIPDKSLAKYCPIEFLYSKSILETHEILEKRNFHEFKTCYKNNDNNADLDTALNEEYTEGSTLRVFKVMDSPKVKFAESTKKLDSTEFENFKPLLALLQKIIEHKK